jgi:transcriptional regulator with XRE-family HTH domain
MMDCMATTPHDPTPTIARRLRHERQQRGWTLDELARRAGVSKAMLSKLERCESSPTAALLGRISGALGMTIGTLLAEGDTAAVRLVRQREQPIWRDPQTGFLRRQVSPLTDLPMQLVEAEMPAGATIAYPAAAFTFIRQAIWVLAGTLQFTEGERVHRLARGDCLELGPPADCEFANPGRSVCRYLVAVVKR